MTRDYSKFTLTPTAGQAAPAQPSPLQLLGWQPFFAQQIASDEMQTTPPARIVEVHRSVLRVGSANGSDTIPPIPETTVGDWVLLDPDHPARSKVLRRKSLLKRRAPGTDRREQLIAANIDTAFIVSSCNLDFNVARLERYIAICFEAEIAPVIVLTKTDLAPETERYETAASAISDRVPVVLLDARGKEPRAMLAPWCKPGQTVAFLGSSGVGKSTLTNALSGHETAATAGIREDDAKGRHTTTSRQLHVIPGGCVVLDTPGMREVQLTDVASGLDDLFADLAELATECRFNDCAHQSEPGCAVRAAIESGTLDPGRLKRWQKLQTEEARNTASLFERRASEKRFGKMVRQITKKKDQSGW